MATTLYKRVNPATEGANRVDSIYARATGDLGTLAKEGLFEESLAVQASGVCIATGSGAASTLAVSNSIGDVVGAGSGSCSALPLSYMVGSSVATGAGSALVLEVSSVSGIAFSDGSGEANAIPVSYASGAGVATGVGDASVLAVSAISATSIANGSSSAFCVGVSSIAGACVSLGTGAGVVTPALEVTLGAARLYLSPGHHCRISICDSTLVLASLGLGAQSRLLLETASNASMSLSPKGCLNMEVVG